MTGGGRGIGREICLALARRGANIMIAARTQMEMEETAKMAVELGAKAEYTKTDIRQERDVEKLTSRTLEKFGSIDILVNNAGVALRKPLVETSLAEYNQIMDTNLMGMFLCIKHALGKMKKGMIINISSGAGKSGIPNLSIYCASKFAVIGLTESLAGEVSGIKTYAICPGGVNTSMYKNMFGSRAMLEPRTVAERIIKLLEEEDMESGSSIEVYR